MSWNNIITKRFFSLGREALLVLAICLTLLPLFTKDIYSTEFINDEGSWIHYGRKYFKLFVLDKDISNRQWKEPEAYDNPPVTKYIIGFTLFLTENDSDKIKSTYWHDDKDFNWNVANGAMPPLNALYVSRFVISIFGILSCVLVYVIARMLFGFKTGIIACLLMANNPLLLRWSQKVVAEAPALFFILLSVIMILLFFSAINKGKTGYLSLLAVLMGISFAFSAGTKVYGIIPWGVFVFVSFFVFLSKFLEYKALRTGYFSLLRNFIQDKIVGVVFGSLIISTVTAGAVFIVINPALYERPFHGAMQMVTIISSYFQEGIQAKQSIYLDHFFSSSGERILAVFKRTFFANPIVYASGNISRIYDSALAYGFVSLGAFFKLSKIPVDFCFFLLGLFMLRNSEINSFLKSLWPSSASIVIIWGCITFASVAISIPFDWERYYLPVVPCTTILIAFGLSNFLGVIYKILMWIVKGLPI